MQLNHSTKSLDFRQFFLSHVAVDADVIILFLPSLSVTDHVLHAAVCGVCDAEPGGIHPFLPERPAGQLAGRLSTGETCRTSASSPPPAPPTALLFVCR